ncbi:unnamed protein product, partial [Didymodactylos carnosus]
LVQAKTSNDPNIHKACEFIRKNKKNISIKRYVDDVLGGDEKEGVILGGLILVADEDVAELVMCYYKNRFGGATRTVHAALNKMYYRISENRIVDVIKSSGENGMVKPEFSNKKPNKIIQARAIMERVQVDLVDLSKKPVLHGGQQLVFSDLFSSSSLHYSVLGEVAHELSKIFAENGNPKIIQTDRGTEFLGALTELCKERGIRRIRSSAYHPESQGKVERINRTWKSKLIFDFLVNNETNWLIKLPSYAETYNTTNNRALGNLSPFYVYHGRQYFHGNGSDNGQDENDDDDYVDLDENVNDDEIQKRLQERMESKTNAEQKMQKYYGKQQEIYEKNAICVKYEVGGNMFRTLVMVKLHGKRFKLFQKRYITANGTIVKAKHDHYQYLVKYKLNGTVQEDWFLVDDVTCQTVKEQEYRLNLAKRKRENDDNSIDVKESEKVKVEPSKRLKHT